MARQEPRTPEFDGTETDPDWGEVDKDFEDYVDAYAESSEGVDEWDDLSADEQSEIAARSLNGDPDADDFENGVVLPVVNPATDNLSAPGLESAIQFAPQTDGIDGEAAQEKARSLLEEHFDRGQEDGKATTMTDGAQTDDHFEKRVELVEKDDDEQIARGAVLVPDRLDHQGDFFREDTIADLREAWSERVADGDAYPGVMHSVFPTDDFELVEDRQLDEPETIGGKDLPAGTWVQGWKYTDDTLWNLVDDEILAGFSIGGTAKGVIYEPGAIPDDVEIPDPVQAELEEAGLSRDDIMVREITDGRILETSTVDRPAVPDAVHAETKALAKAAPALTDNVVAARLYLEARGHDPDDARRLAEYLQENKAVKSDGGLVDRAKSFFGFGKSRGPSRANVIETPDADPREQTSDELAESSAGSHASSESKSWLEGTDMSEDDINEKLEALDSRLDDIDEKVSEIDADGEAAGGDGEEKNTGGDGGDGGSTEPSTEEKLDQLADHVLQMSETVEEMAEAQGVSQQADQGNGTNGKEKIWGEKSPFARGGD